MFNLFLRTLSQGLQAFIPVAASWTWFRRSDPGIASSIGLGTLVSIPVTFVAARLFAASTQKALNESMLAGAALVAALAFLSAVWAARSQPFRAAPSHGRPVTVFILAATVLVIVRQSMEMATTFNTAFFEMRSFEATRAVVSGTLLAGCVGVAWVWAGRRATAVKLASATRSFALLFAIQVLVYGLHEASEARLLPFSETLHEASEPYGPDGVYGLHFSDLLVLVPMLAAALTRMPMPRMACLLLPVALLAGSHLPPGPGGTVQAAGADPSALMRQPFILFRDTTTGPTFSMATVVPLSAPEGQRVSAGVSCERVSFSPVLTATPGQGICLKAAQTFFNLFTGYTALFLDGTLKDRGIPMKLEGKPSRTRVSPDGRLGALTVFVFGDGYSSADFSTRTLIVDMSTGSKIADLEEFTASRNGEKFAAKDFNYWGVTFARDGDTIYASMRTAGKTYLVRGSVAKRSFNVLRDNVECPSLSPDGKRLAFKKFVGPDPGAWRIATLELASMSERLVEGETRYVDDQMEWLDANRILYAVPRRTTASSDVWVVPVDGNTPPRIFIPLAESPIVVR